MAYSTFTAHKGLSPLDARTFSLRAVLFTALSFLLTFFIQIVLEDAF